MFPRQSKDLTRRRKLNKPKGFTKLLLRLPIGLYRVGLGRLLGERFLLLSHRGRKSGKRRETVIEVAGKDAASGCYYAVAAWGNKADWWLNIRRQANCRVQVGAKRFEARARTLPNEEAEHVVLDYAHRHPTAIKAIAGFIGFDVDGSDEHYKQLARLVPVVEFRPTKT